MLGGFFDSGNGSPYLQGRIILPGLNFIADVDFLVDTGADTTLLAPGDGQRFHADYTALRYSMPSQGTAGISENYVERGFVALRDDREPIAHVFVLEVHVLVPNPSLIALPSLIGRDILDRCRMTYDPSVGELTFEVHLPMIRCHCSEKG